ncbi:hypothetical protein [Micromonospora sp. LOL_015]|uniref:hypothetical protein n=1 Tax=Micromonospora sp. LOL_015 TaxID=3345416 RepID=UPI003A8423D4
MTPDEASSEPLTAAQRLAADLGCTGAGCGVRLRPPRIFDGSALIDLFHGYRELGELLDQTESG